MKAMGATLERIESITQMKRRSLQYLFKKALDRGWHPTTNPLILDGYIIDAPRAGKKLKVTREFEQRILKKVTTDRFGREKSCAYIAAECGCSAQTVWRVLRRHGYRKTKPTKKPCLTKAMKEARLQFAMQYKDWTIDDWKNVIWSDETGVVLHHRRGGYKLWRLAQENTKKSSIRPRFKKATEFMFWGAFSYDRKSPCLIWRPETAAEKKASKIELQKINEAIEPELREAWELTTGIRRMGLRNKPGKKPQFRMTEENGAIKRTAKNGGIDWYRYLTKCLLPILIPFAIECQIDRPKTIIQEDKAPAHSSKHQRIYFDAAGLQRLLWPGNSPDLNMIEPCWYYLKRATTKKGAPKNRAEAERVWQKAWDELEQWRIQAWIERIPRHIQEVIRLEGGNEYREGAADSARDWKALKKMDQYRRQVIDYMRQQVLLSLNRADPNKPLLKKPQPVELPQLMQIGPHLPHKLIDLEPLHHDHDPKLRRRRRPKWEVLESTKPKASSNKPLKPLPPIKPPPQPRSIQNRPNTKARNWKKAEFKVSFVEPQTGQQQQEQQQEQRQEQRQEQQALNGQQDQYQAADIRWRTVNQPKRKWVRKDNFTTSNKAVNNSRTCTKV